MRKITIVIPTRNRANKLEQTLDSIPQCDWINTVIGVDNDRVTYKWFKNSKFEINEDEIDIITYIKSFNAENLTPFGAVFIRNDIISRFCNDGVLYATDDIIFDEGAIEHAFKEFNNRFKDDDGVIGFVQRPGKRFHPSGVALVGQKFLQRYPEKQLFYPKYFHFACQEIYNLANKYNKFYQDKEACVLHRHPILPDFKEEHDKTHEDARIYKVEDMKIKFEREQQDLIWGDK